MRSFSRTLEVFRLECGRWNLVAAFSGEDKERAETFESFELETHSIGFAFDATRQLR
jgi:hypothetical protein